MNRLKQHRALLAYLLLALCFTLALVRYERFHLDEQRQIARQEYRLCLVARENRDILRDLVNRQTAELVIPPGADPALVEIIEQAKRNNAAFLVDANRRLDTDEPVCTDPATGLTTPPHGPGLTTPPTTTGP